MRKEVSLVIVLLVILLFLFQSDISFRYSSSVAGEWKYGYQSEDPRTSDVQQWSSERSTKDGPRMNELSLRWGSGHPIPQTALLRHSSGFTVFDNLYAINGTLYIVTNNGSAFPELRHMTSTGYPVFNSEEEVAKREPTDRDMKIISVREAGKLFGTSGSRVEGVTFMTNDPPQFINHYYHFAAELLVGIWRTYASLDLGIQATGKTALPPPKRFILPHVKESEWRDYAKMNQYVFHGAFPSTSMEYSEDWADRSETTKVWKFDRVVFTDRAAAMRVKRFTDVERYAAPAFELPGSTNFWEPLRNNVVEFAGGSRMAGAGTRSKPVITYVTRQE
jgi:hypothetical protein